MLPTVYCCSFHNYSGVQVGDMTSHQLDDDNLVAYKSVMASFTVDKHYVPLLDKLKVG